MIKIETKKIVKNNGECGREIIRIEAFEKSELPKLYTNGKPACWIDSYGDLTTTCNDYISPKKWYPEKKFQEFVAHIRECGTRLREVNNQLAQARELWNGEETFKI